MNLSKQVPEHHPEVVPLKEVLPQTINDFINIQYSDEDQKLKIREGVIVIKKKDQSTYHNSRSEQKKVVLAKVHSIDDEITNKSKNQQNLTNRRIKEQPSSNCIFSVDQNIKKIRNCCREITIENCNINMYALKKLIKITSQMLKRLTISHCTFFESDYSALHNKNSSLNNKMLKELSFAFQIAAQQLPQIENIKIELLTSNKNGQNELKQKFLQNQKKRSKTLKQVEEVEITQDQKKEKLAQQYECNIDSLFINFELNIRSELEKKYQKYKNQQELVESFLNGKQSNNSQVEKCIDENIINDIYNHVFVFNKYIKSALYLSKQNLHFLIIQKYCLEDPIAMRMIKNLVFKNRKLIKTVIFKETGTISSENFIDVIDILFVVQNLESISFLDSQPPRDPKCYQLIHELNSIKSFKHIVLNRSSFDISQFRSQNFGMQENQKEKQNKQIITVPKHYAFYILNTRDSKKEAQEFTPYEYCIQQLLFPEVESTNFSSESLLQYEIGHLIQEQQKLIDIQQEICKYQEDSILSFDGICEKIIIKHSPKDSEQLNQQEMENDIRTLIKHQNYHSIKIAQKLIMNLKDKTLQQNLKLMCSNFQSDQYWQEFNPYDYNRLFLREQLLIPYQTTGQLIYKQFISNGFPFTIYRDYRIFFEHKGFQSCSQLNSINVEKIFSIINKNQIGILFEFNDKYFSMYDMINDIDTILLPNCVSLLSFKILNSSSEQFYQSEQFLKKFHSLLQYSDQTINLEVCYDDMVNVYQICSSHLQVLENMKNIKIEILEITMSEARFQFCEITSLKTVKTLCLKSVKIDRESFKNSMNLQIEILEFSKCTIEYIDIAFFKHLKEIRFIKCNMTEQIAKQLLLQQNSDKDHLNYLEKGRPLILIKLQKKVRDNPILSKEIVNILVNHQNYQTPEIMIRGINEDMYDYFLEIMESKFPSKLNPDLLQRFLGTNLAHLYRASKQQQENKCSPSESDMKNQKEINKENYFKNEKQSFFQKKNDLFQKLKANYSSFLHLELQSDMLSFTYTYKDKCIKSVSQCCKNLLSITSEEQRDNLDLFNEMKNHNGEFCFFKTSLFQSQFKPTKLQIKFFDNLLFFNPEQIFQNKDIEYIEELEFVECFIVDFLQVKFIDMLIQASPRLKILNFKKMYIQNEKKDQMQRLFTPLKKHKNLKSLKLSRCEVSVIQQIFEAITQSEINSLQKLKLYEYIDCKVNLQDFIKKNRNTLRELKVYIKNTSLIETILSIENLEKLSLLPIYPIDIEEFPINQILKMTKLQIFNIYYRDFLNISSKFLDLILNAAIDTSSHLHMFSIKKCWKKKQQIDTYFAKKQSEDKNQRIPIIYINQNVKLVESESNQEEKNLREFILSRYSLIVNLLDLGTISPNNLSSLELPYLKEFHVSKQDNYFFLNNIFDSTRDCLQVLRFANCNLTSESFRNVDFSKLPRTLNKLMICGDTSLTTLGFLEPVFKKVQEYKKMAFDIRSTIIPLSEILKFIPYIKSVKHKHIQLWYSLHPIMQQKQWDTDYQVEVVKTFYQAMNQFEGEDEVKLIFNQYFQKKIDLSQQEMRKIYPLIFSPLQIESLQHNLNNSAIAQISSKQRDDGRKSQKNKIGNKYLFFFNKLLCNSHKYILSYSKSYHDPYFHIQKKIFSRDAHEIEEADLFDSEHLFSDYLLLIEVLESQNLKQILLPLFLNVSYQMMHSKKINTCLDEKTMVEYLTRIPPSELVIEDMSIQFVKTWYVINATSQMAFKTTISSFDTNKVFNNSIGCYLTSGLNRNNFFRKILSNSSQKYRYDETVQFLASNLEDQIKAKNHILMLSLFPLYIFVCIFSIIFFSLHFDIKCGNGISWYSYYSYLVYGIMTFFIELFLFKRCLSYISHLVPSMEINLNPGCIVQTVNMIKQIIIDSTWINQWYVGYSYSFIQSQLARFDNFTNVAFLYSTYQCQNYEIFYISLCFISIPFLHALYEFYETAFNHNQKKHQLPTASLDMYYKICNIIEFKAVADILDLVSPSNVTVIQGRMYNSRIISCFVRIIGESLPLIIIQIYNLVQNDINSSLILSVLLSILTFLILLVNLLTIAPSTLYQEDFNKLNEMKRSQKILEKYEARLQEFEDEMFAFRFIEYLKKVRPLYLRARKQSNYKALNDTSCSSNQLQNGGELIQENQSHFDELFDTPYYGDKEMQEIDQHKNEYNLKIE